MQLDPGWFTHQIVDRLGELLRVCDVKQRRLLSQVADENQLEEDDAGRPDVNLGIVVAIADDQLGRSEGPCADVVETGGRLIVRITNQFFATAEVADLDLVDRIPIVADEYVAQLDVSVRNTERMQVSQAEEDSAHNLLYALNALLLRFEVGGGVHGMLSEVRNVQVGDCERQVVGHDVEVLLDDFLPLLFLLRLLQVPVNQPDDVARLTLVGDFSQDRNFTLHVVTIKRDLFDGHILVVAYVIMDDLAFVNCLENIPKGAMTNFFEYSKLLGDWVTSLKARVEVRVLGRRIKEAHRPVLGSDDRLGWRCENVLVLFCLVVQSLMH